MEQANQTETEQIYNDMTGKADDKPEQVEENETEEKLEQETEETTEQEQDEEILSEEELEIEREIAEYATKIEQLDAKLAEHKAQHIDAMKREKMKEAHYTDEQIDRYIDFIDGTTEEEIAESVFQLEIPPAGDNYGDPSPMNGAKQRYAVDHESVGREIGKKAFERVKNKIHGLRWW